MPRVLFIGDIVGAPGRKFVYRALRGLREQLKADLVVANAENAAGGSGLNASITAELMQAGVDGITLGDHVWDQRGFEMDLPGLETVCRPANLPPQCPGRTHLILEKDGFRLAVFTVLGRTFMNMKADCPFLASDNKMQEFTHLPEQQRPHAVLAEIHAETTSEKCAYGWYMDGRAAFVPGTHTHIPTADGRVLPRGTAYITDVGMTGPYESCLGRSIEPVLLRFLDGLPRKFTVAEHDVRLCGAIVTIDPETGAATDFERVEVADTGELDSLSHEHRND